MITQMALAGASRAEIEGRLRRQFGIEDAGAILGEVLAGTSIGEQRAAG